MPHYPYCDGDTSRSSLKWASRSLGASRWEYHRDRHTPARAKRKKKLQLITEVVPRISHIGVLGVLRRDSPTTAIAFQEYEIAARALKIQLQSLEVRDPNPDIEGAIQIAAQRSANALITITNPLLSRYRKRIADVAIKNRLPSMYEGSAWVEAGDLMSYSTNDLEIFRRVATFVDKILKGAKPADLPVEQPTKFELVINGKTDRSDNSTARPGASGQGVQVTYFDCHLKR